MPDTLQPYIELAKDAGLALTDAGYAYTLLVAAAPLLTLAGLIVLMGLIATHGKSHGTRFSAMSLFVMASLAGAGAWLLQPDASAGTMLQTMLNWAWVPTLVAALALFTTMPEKPKARALGLLATTAIALVATTYGGMLAIANQRTMHPDDMAWLDAPPMPTDSDETPGDETNEPRAVLNTAAKR